MKKILYCLVVSVVAIIVSGCGSTKYSKTEQEYLDTMYTAAKELQNNLESFQFSLFQRNQLHKKDEEYAQSLFEGMLAISVIHEALKKVDPPKRFEKDHTQFIKGLNMLNEISLRLSTQTATDEDNEKYNESIKLINSSSRKLQAAYHEATASTQ